MIKGKTRDQKRAEAEAWIPVRLADGRWIWRESYFYRDSSADWRGRTGCFSMPFRQRLLEVPATKYGPLNPPFPGSAVQRIITPVQP